MAIKGSKRIKPETLKKFVISASLIGVALAFVLISFLIEKDIATIGGFDYNERCGGEELCYLNLYDVCVANDTFIYPMNGTWALNTTPQEKLEWIKLYRGWGKGLREIKLNDTCTGSWCGCYWCKFGLKAKFTYAYRKGKCYNLTFKAKKDAYSEVSWKFNPEGTWLPNKKRIELIDECEEKIEYYNVTTNHPSYDYKCVENKTRPCDTLACTQGECLVIFFNHTYITTETKNRTIKFDCKQVILINDKKYYPAEDNFYCKENGWNNITCDSTLDGNGDGIIDFGQYGKIFTVEDNNIKYESTDKWAPDKLKNKPEKLDAIKKVSLSEI